MVAGTRSHYQLFNATDWREAWRVPRDGALYSAGPCAFSPDGRQVAVAKSRQTAAILDVNTGHELTQLVSPRPATIKALRWSPDGRRLVVGTAENLVQVWELGALRTELASLRLPWDGASALAASGVASIAFAPVGNPASPTAWALLLGLLAAGLITLVALMALRRHRQLIEGFAHTEALAGQRERELQVEREVGQLKSSFVSLVSHEFRTPLGVITASAGNLQRYFSRLSDDDRRNLLGDIINSSSRMRDLIEEVLLLGKVDSGKMKCERVSVDLPALCRRTITDVSAAYGPGCYIGFASEGINGELQLDETLTGIILVNLLNNAVKYSPAGNTVRLTIRSQGNDAIIEVRDQGIGIPAADQKELFKSFHRGGNVGNLPGTGLGLAIVKRCVDLHHGQISFASLENRCTTFTVSLPSEAPSAAA
jgi:signal transduction histidine kinase